MKSLHLILVLFSIASMFTSFGVYDVDATHNDNGTANSNGCDKNNNPNQAKNNPHCYNDDPAPPTACPNGGSDPNDCDGDGIPNSEDPCPYGGSDPNDCDRDGIPNSEDACPYLKNINSVRGSPDHDGDGKMDSKDSTPCGDP